MPVPLREPFFLRGRRSVLQRAILMSLSLATIGWTAGLGASLFASAILAHRHVDPFQKCAEATVAYNVSAVVALAFCAGIPYFFWAGSSVRGIVVRVVWILAAGIGSVWMAGGERLWIWSCRLYGDLDSCFGSSEGLTTTLRFIALAPWLYPTLILCWIVWSLACIRRSWLFPGITVLSMACFPLWFATIHLVFWSDWIPRRWLAGSGGDLYWIIADQSIIGYVFVLLLVPWGIPFWWPPKSAAPLPERE